MALAPPLLEGAILLALQQAKIATNPTIATKPPLLAPTPGEIALAKGLAEAIDKYIRTANLNPATGTLS